MTIDETGVINQIIVYSYSQAFGRANHKLAAQIIRDIFPGCEVRVDMDLK